MSRVDDLLAKMEAKYRNDVFQATLHELASLNQRIHTEIQGLEKNVSDFESRLTDQLHAELQRIDSAAEAVVPNHSTTADLELEQGENSNDIGPFAQDTRPETTVTSVGMHDRVTSGDNHGPVWA